MLLCNLHTKTHIGNTRTPTHTSSSQSETQDGKRMAVYQIQIIHVPVTHLVV